MTIPDSVQTIAHNLNSPLGIDYTQLIIHLRLFT